MKISLLAIEELRTICKDSFQRQFTDAELQEIGLRIIRFLLHSKALADFGDFDDV